MYGFLDIHKNSFDSMFCDSKNWKGDNDYSKIRKSQQGAGLVTC